MIGERAQKTDRTGVKNCEVEANQTRETRMRGQRGTAVSGDEKVKESGCEGQRQQENVCAGQRQQENGCAGQRQQESGCAGQRQQANGYAWQQ